MDVRVVKPGGQDRDGSQCNEVYWWVIGIYIEHVWLLWYNSTLFCISSAVAIQVLHFLNENPTPILKPPNWCAARVSAKSAKTVPFTLLT